MSKQPPMSQVARRRQAEHALRSLHRNIEMIARGLESEAREWREDHPVGADDEVDYASGLLSAAVDLRELLAARDL